MYQIIKRIRTLLSFPFSFLQIKNHLLYVLTKKGESLSYRPLWLLFYLSDICNLRCKMCPTHTVGDVSRFDYAKTEFGIMSFDVFSKIISQFPEATLVMLAGVGEPLLNPDFIKIIRCCSQYKKRINLVTNGIFLDMDKIVEICSNHRFNEISISLNASNAEDYNKITNTDGTYHSIVMHNIKNIVDMKKKLKSKVKIVVSAVCSNEFIEKMYDFVKVVSELNVDKIIFHNYIDFGIKEEHDQRTPINKSENISESLQRQLIQIESLGIKNIELVVPTQNIGDPLYFNKKCEWFFKSLSFDAYGNIGSCGRVMNPNQKYGNILSGIEKDIWNGRYMKYMRSLFLEKNKQLPSCCNSCIENF